MNKFEFKNLVKNLKHSLKEKKFFKELRKEVEIGANGTQDYVVKKVLTKIQLLQLDSSLFISSCNTSQTQQDEVHVQTCVFPQTSKQYRHRFGHQ